MKPLTQAEARQYSPMALAFLGDSVYEVMVREYLLRAANQQQQRRTKKRIPASGFFRFFFCNKVKYFPVPYYDKIVSAVIMFSHG